jgi:membrane protease YdiL (CAAX protease family)
MNRISPEYIAFSVLLALLIISIAAMAWSWVWAVGRILEGLPIIAPDRAREFKRVPWGGLTVLSLVFLYLGVNLFVGRMYVAVTGRHLPRFASALKNRGDALEPVGPTDQSKNTGEPPAAREVLTEDRIRDAKAALARPATERTPEQSIADLMFQSALSNGLLLFLVPTFVWLTSRASLIDLGLYWKAWPRQIGTGVRAAMLMTPPVCALQFLTTRIWRSQTHPVEQMVLEKLTTGVATLAVLSTVVLAPWIEELLFRGIFQRWLERFVDDGTVPAKTSQESERSVTRIHEDKILFWEPPYASLKHEPLESGDDSPKSRLELVDKPALPLFRLPIFFTSVLFAALHLPQWPAPIAIFVLSVSLGTVYQRSGSLLSSIAMHAAFNGVNTLILLLAALSQRIHAPIEHASTASFPFSSLSRVLSLLFT